MINFYRIFCVFLMLALVSSCGSKRKIAHNKEETREISRPASNSEAIEYSTHIPQPPYANKVERYIARFAPIAQQEMVLYKIPASITLAQGILESGSGESRLSVEANNHFGIKCHNWDGARIFHDDDRRQECFRKYKDAKYSYRDHSLFLTGRRRYAGLFELEITDYKGWAKGLRKAGYATDRKYPDKLISIIERYLLYRFDNEVLGKGQSPNVEVAFTQRGNTTEKYVVQKGDTLYSISRRYGLSVNQLQEYNNIRGSAINIGQILYLEPIPNN